LIFDGSENPNGMLIVVHYQPQGENQGIIASCDGSGFVSIFVNRTCGSRV
jgi:hypothetical protein